MKSWNRLQIKLCSPNILNHFYYLGSYIALCKGKNESTSFPKRKRPRGYESQLQKYIRFTLKGSPLKDSGLVNHQRLLPRRKCSSIGTVALCHIYHFFILLILLNIMGTSQITTCSKKYLIVDDSIIIVF